MSEDHFNLSMRKFLKSVGVTSQQKIEEAVRGLNQEDTAKQVTVTVTLSCDEINLSHEVTGTIDLP
jgi:phage gp46-like protein